MSKETVRVMIVDDQGSMRQSLAIFLEVFEDLELVGQARYGKEALGVCARVHPAVILMNLTRPEREGIMALESIHQGCPEAKIIALTGFSDASLARDALAAGAAAILIKSTPIDELAAAIRQVCGAADGGPSQV